MKDSTSKSMYIRLNRRLLWALKIMGPYWTYSCFMVIVMTIFGLLEVSAGRSWGLLILLPQLVFAPIVIYDVWHIFYIHNLMAEYGAHTKAHDERKAELFALPASEEVIAEMEREHKEFMKYMDTVSKRIDNFGFGRFFQKKST